MVERVHEPGGGVDRRLRQIPRGVGAPPEDMGGPLSIPMRKQGKHDEHQAEINRGDEQLLYLRHLEGREDSGAAEEKIQGSGV